MIATTVRARLLTALLMIAGSLSVALVADGAAAAPSYNLNLTVSTSRPNVGQAVKLSGKVRPAAPGQKVRVQAKAAGTGWVTMAKPRLRKNSTYRASVTFPRAGKVSIRIVKSRSRTNAKGISRVRNLRVGDALTAPVITTTTLPPGAVGADYSATVETADQRAGAFTVASGSLPAGLTLDDQTGDIAGIPTTEGASTFVIRFTDADGLSDTQSFSLTVLSADAAPTISTTTLPSGQVGVAYTTRMATTGDRVGTWSIASGTLPSGLALAADSGTISGTPTLAGTFPFTAKFTETATGLTDTQDLSIAVAPAGDPVISTTSLPTGEVDKAYTATLRTLGDRSGTWSIPFLFGGKLPAGLTLNGSTGVISGTPTSVGTESFTVTFTATGGGSASKALSITIYAAGTGPTISTTSLPAGTVSKPYAAQLATVGNRAGSWTLSAGSLPAGLGLNAATGAITGTPTAAGTSAFTVRFTQTGGLTDSRNLSITIDLNSPPVISTTTLPGGVVSHHYSATLQTVGNRTGTWAVSAGSLPAGLALSAASGVISGTPTIAGTNGFTVVFTSASGLTDSQALSITIDPNTPPVITQTTLPDGKVAVTYSQQLTTVGNRAGSWSLSAGSGPLPAGLTLSVGGLISGKPTVAGTSSFSVLFTASGGQTDTQSLSIKVVP